ncbi:Hypothetical predicted protein [Pelobates cultripes]|uniref:Uncharacterized protein n=1 Tax=Pelobates cultripes TaxID=61616 RepID=A0AAD1S4W1_PELCU|nr:Hypothetical predicted protein [Pelobates cultripes]
MAPKMATPPDRELDAEVLPAGMPEPSTAEPTMVTPAGRDKQSPATKQDIADLLQEMRQQHAADLNLLQTEIHIASLSYKCIIVIQIIIQCP